MKLVYKIGGIERVAEISKKTKSDIILLKGKVFQRIYNNGVVCIIISNSVKMNKVIIKKDVIKREKDYYKMIQISVGMEVEMFCRQFSGSDNLFAHALK